MAWKLFKILTRLCRFIASHVSNCFKRARNVGLYLMVWAYIKMRWLIYSWTGLWGFNTRTESENISVTDGKAKESEKSKRDLEGEKRTVPSCVFLAQAVRLKKIEVVPGKVKYLGKFIYESWNDRRWRPTEEDYEADDEADEMEDVTK